MAASFEGMGAEEATAFAARWLPAWTGNDPDRLLSFYTDDAFYSDPAIPHRLTGREALRRYFAALLARFPDWEWSNPEANWEPPDLDDSELYKPWELGNRLRWLDGSDWRRPRRANTYGGGI